MRRHAALRRLRRAAQPAIARRQKRLKAPPPIPARTRRALAVPPPIGLLVAEGDSWFDYPLHDVLSMLEHEHGFEVASVAHHGDTVENMAYGSGQFDDFTHCLTQYLSQGRVPNAILLSGGGNDIAGAAFEVFLNHAQSDLPTVSDDIVRGVVDVRLRNAYTYLIAGLTKIATDYLQRPIPIVVHGYDYAVPDGRGFLGGWAFLPGPWLKPGLVAKGYDNLNVNRGIVKALIDAFNDLLIDVSRAYAHVHYVDLRGTLINGAGYTDDWANELHPTKRGFSAVAAKIARVL